MAKGNTVNGYRSATYASRERGLACVSTVGNSQGTTKSAEQENFVPFASFVVSPRAGELEPAMCAIPGGRLLKSFLKGVRRAKAELSHGFFGGTDPGS